MVNKDVVLLVSYWFIGQQENNAFIETFSYKNSKSIYNSAVFETLCAALSDKKYTEPRQSPRFAL
jgi:hypothetical protein